MWLEKFSKIISVILDKAPFADRLLVSLAEGRQADAILHLNPDKIYLENIRSILGVPTAIAKLICETAVRKGLFFERVEVLSPDDTVVLTAANEQELPESISYMIFEGEDYDRQESATKDLKKRTYYQLNKTIAYS